MCFKQDSENSELSSSSNDSSSSDDEILRVKGMASTEQFILEYAREHGKSWDAAFNTLLRKKSLEKKSTQAKNMNYHDATVRGRDLQRSFLGCAKFSINEYEFTQSMMQQLGAQDRFTVERKAGDLEFNEPISLICALGNQMLRFEQRYLLDQIDFAEAYARKADHFKTLLSVAFDLWQFGFDNTIINNIHTFSSEMVEPSLNLKSFDRPPMIQLDQKENENGQPAVPSSDLFTPFALKGTQVMYQQAQVMQSATLTSPLGTLYQSKRKNYGLYQVRRSLYEKHRAQEHIRYTASGACWNYNFGHRNCPHCGSCNNKKKSHLVTHVCALCAAKHPFYLCPFARAFMAIVDADRYWSQKTYDTKAVRIHIPGLRKSRYEDDRSYESSRDKRDKERDQGSSQSSRHDKQKRKSKHGH